MKLTLPYSVSGLVDWFVRRFGPLPSQREPALREIYWRLWDAAVDSHIRSRRFQARAGARILRRLGLRGLRSRARSFLPWSG